MADLRISELAALASADLATGDFLAVADVSASDTRRITVTGFVDKAVTLISDATIPNAKILFTANTLSGDALADGTVSGAKLSANGVAGTRLANNSTCQLVAALPASGSYVGQLALNTNSDAAYIWNGSVWVEFQAAGSVNEIIGSSAGVVNVVVTQVGDSVTISTTLDDTTAASQFLAGPTSAGGATTYRAIEGADLPTATTTTKGAVVVSGNGLTLSGNTIAIDNSIEAEATDYHVVQYDVNGLVTAGRLIQSGDLPEATASATGVVRPGTGLAVDVAGTLNHSNVIVGGSGTKVTFDSEGHITATETLAATDIPDLSADKITTGQLPTARIANAAITGSKLAASSVTKIGGSADTGGVVVFPAPDYSGQYFYDSRNGDLYLWDGNAWQPITITAGEIVFAGTYSSSDNTIATVTTAGAAAGLTVGSALPAAADGNNRYYVIVNDSGTGTSPAPTVALQAPDMLLSDGTAWTLIDVSNTIVTQQADGINITAISGMSATDVQEALEELYAEKVDKTGGTFTGDVTLDGADLIYDTGSFNTTVTATTASAARTITYPDATGIVLLAGNASIVNADINASAAIAYSKLASLTSGQIIVGSSGNVPTAAAVTGDITLNSAGVTAIAAGAVVNADISASAAIGFSKLAALTSGNILVGNGSNVAASVPMTGDVTIGNTGVAAIASGVIVNADVNASAAIAGSKIQAATTSNAGAVQLSDSTSSTSTTTAATPNAVKTAYDLAVAALPKSGGTMVGDITFSTNSATADPDGTPMGSLLFKGYDGSVFRTGASIVANVDDPTAGSVSGDLVFSVTESGDTATTPRYRIDNYGAHAMIGKNSVLFSASEAAAGTSYATFIGRHSATTINSGTNSCFIYSNGNIYNTNNVYSVISDASLKENIIDASSQWSDVKDIKVRNFNFKVSTGHETNTQIGFIAQEVEQVSPGLVEEINTGNNTVKGVKTSVLLVKAVKALQEAMDRIEELEQRLASAGL